RDDAGQADHAQRQRRPRDQVDVPVQGHRLHLRPGRGDELSGPQPTEITMPKGVVRASGPAHIRNTPKRVSGMGAFSAAEMPRASTVRVSRGAITPSSHNLALE